MMGANGGVRNLYLGDHFFFFLGLESKTYLYNNNNNNNVKNYKHFRHANKVFYKLIYV